MGKKSFKIIDWVGIILVILAFAILLGFFSNIHSSWGLLVGFIGAIVYGGLPEKKKLMKSLKTKGIPFIMMAVLLGAYIVKTHSFSYLLDSLVSTLLTLFVISGIVIVLVRNSLKN